MSAFHECADVDAMGFMPLDLVDVHVGRLTAKLYPKIGPAMKIWERAYAYQIAKTFINAFPHNEPLSGSGTTPVMLLCRGTSPSCSNCRHGRYRHRVDVDCCDPHHGHLLLAKMPIDCIFFSEPVCLIAS